jgi:Phage integrase, N-terminal SAM-like domain
MTRPAGSQPPRPLPDEAPVPARIPTVARYLARWLTAVVEPDLEPATYAYYETMARLYVSPALGSIRLDLLQLRDVQAWLDQLPRVCQCCAQGKDAARPTGRQRCCAIGACCHRYPGRRTVQAARDTLRAALNHALTSDHLVPGNVAAFATVPGACRRRREGSAWAPAQACRFLASTYAGGDPLFAAYVLVLACALSKAEVLGLTWTGAGLDTAELDISWQLQRAGGQLIHKRRSEAEYPDAGIALPMPGICAAALWLRAGEQAAAREQAGARWQDSDLVFTTRWGTAIEPRNFNRSFDARCARAGVPRIAVHDTRRACAPLLAALDVHPEIVARILRHAKIATPTAACAQAPDEITRAALRKLGDSLDGVPRAAQDRP